MLLIGSRAANHYFNFRKPHDYDFIASEQEVNDFLSKHNHKISKIIDKKICAIVDLGRKYSFEFELINKGNKSADLIYDLAAKSYNDSLLRTNYNIVSPEILLLLKRSHIPFNIHFKKNIIDYCFLNERIKLNPEYNHIFNLRLEETKHRIKFQEKLFDIDNSEFFKKSEKAVKRYVPHDNIHRATCFFDEPLFLSVKDDLTKAAISENKVNALSDDLKIKLLQEEIIALTLERYIIPCLVNKKPYDLKNALLDISAKMVHNFLPMFFRLYAADNYMKMIDINHDFVEQFLLNVKDFKI